MSNDQDLPRSKVAMRGRMLVAWLAEATPPVLWRFVASDVSGGFGLRHAESKVELVQYDGGAHPQVIATFTSEASAERALSRLSRALAHYQAPWKIVAKTLASVFTVLILLLALRVYIQYEVVIAHLQNLASSVNRPAAGAASPGNVPLMLPGMAPSGSGNSSAGSLPMGAPVDVDKAYK